MQARILHKASRLFVVEIKTRWWKPWRFAAVRLTESSAIAMAKVMLARPPEVVEALLHVDDKQIKAAVYQNGIVIRYLKFLGSDKPK